MEGIHADEFFPGDLIDNPEQLAANAVVGNTTLLATDVASPILQRSGSGGAFADTWPSAAQIVAALQGSYGGLNVASLFYPPALSNLAYQNAQWAQSPMSQPSAYRWLYLNLVAFAATMVVPATSGIITAGSTPLAVAASSWREYLVTILSGRATQILSGTVTNASNVITALLPQQIRLLERDMSVYGTNIPALTRIQSINPDLSTVTLTANATGTLAANAITFTPTVQFTSLRSGAI